MGGARTAAIELRRTTNHSRTPSTRQGWPGDQQQHSQAEDHSGPHHHLAKHERLQQAGGTPPAQQTHSPAREAGRESQPSLRPQPNTHHRPSPLDPLSSNQKPPTLPLAHPHPPIPPSP
ncbi:hypothetical protein PtA15_3A104 [Puccinia triticina]|uniref:Uncharacterized protein n=1 Tax=Puccinia triticina TaxID=208348 RepID=A0ABY7CD98_9BASI|nr:uncharacterized protein PtA15_3A104 [Puccinia triticina]WAQ82740.1 hypothetical protein PtA15_3A104 [Puccinia triticina]